jgi:glycerophosphoryl diester phosphodiesterase
VWASISGWRVPGTIRWRQPALPILCNEKLVVDQGRVSIGDASNFGVAAARVKRAGSGSTRAGSFRQTQSLKHAAVCNFPSRFSEFLISRLQLFHKNLICLSVRNGNNLIYMKRRYFLKMAGVGTGVAVISPLLLADAEKKDAKVDPFHSGKKFFVAHRGASAYAPENTIPAYLLAIKQGADYVEQDLHISRDGVLMCAHDFTLERVTNVQEVFPDRFKEELVKGQKVKKWYLHDFTVKEIQQLDAGSHLDSKFKGVTIPTWQEAIDAIKGKAGLCPETKGPEVYGKLGFDMESLVLATLKKNNLETPKAGNSDTPVYLQSFSKASLKKLRQVHHVKWPMLWLSSAKMKWTPELLQEAKVLVESIGPEKHEVTAALVEQAHALGLKVFPYTFLAGDEKPFKDVREQMSHYLYELGVDGMFTNNPDKFPRQKSS